MLVLHYISDNISQTKSFRLFLWIYTQRYTLYTQFLFSCWYTTVNIKRKLQCAPNS
ncbi:hypothetical protein RCV-Z_ORF94 [Rana catesbeiana virus]|uniref:Uncharacterized protein n=1 Tax=Rana esculenta virus TaxID=575980 RepID=A0A222NTY9_9VIRU|nr:hypothetical protein RCV-Z_ORF98 [Rana catesbeiana virus]ASQ42961.1 hypothetical protein [Rana esculenta virus]ASU44322.1 hypothetical protein RCV-Z_ORF94 [Rana catesbeiana virus]